MPRQCDSAFGAKCGFIPHMATLVHPYNARETFTNHKPVFGDTPRQRLPPLQLATRTSNFPLATCAWEQRYTDYNLWETTHLINGPSAANADRRQSVCLAQHPRAELPVLQPGQDEGYA
jgi:hypothetical protein